MRRLAGTWVLGLLLVCGGSAGAARGEEGAGFPSSDEQLLRRAKMPTDTEGLLAYLRMLSAGEAPELKVQELVRELGAGEFSQRERAAQRLVGLGRLALPVLRKNVDNEDVEVARRAKACIAEIDRLPWLNLPLIVTRLLVRRKVEEAVPVLLGYLGHTADPDVEEEIYYGLDELAVRDGRIHPALAAALTDASPARRAVAGCILGRVGDARQRERVRKLLEDPDAKVRLRSAQGLLTSREKAAVPVLVGLLDEPAVEIAWQAEELLHWIAGESSPESVEGTASAAERRRCQKAWQWWWEERKGEVDWEAAEQDCRRPGLVLSWHWMDGESDSLRFRLCGCDGGARFAFEQKVRDCTTCGGVWWSGKGLILPERGPDLHPNVGEWTRTKEGYLLPPAPRAIRLREVDLAGKTLWESERFETFMEPNWRRLGDGRTLVSDGVVAIDLDARGHATSKRKLAPFDEANWKQAGGRTEKVIPDDSTVRGDPIGPGQGWFGKEGRLLASRSGTTGTYSVEYDTAGGECVSAMRPQGNPNDLATQVRWATEGSSSAARLRNGHVVIGHGAIRKPVREENGGEDWGPLEVDNKGRKVWEGPRTTGTYAAVEVLCPLVRFGFRRGASAEPSLDTVTFRLRMLKSRTPLFRYRAAEWLQSAPASKEAGIAMVEWLTDPNPAMRLMALRCVYKARSDLGYALRKIAQRLEDESEDVWREAVEELGQWGPEAVPVLVEIAESKGKSVEARFRAARVLTCYLKESHPGVIPAVRHAIREGPPKSRADFIWSLNGKAGLEMDLFLPDLLGVLQNKSEEDLAGTVALVIGSFGSKAETAVPVLLDALDDRRTRGAAAVALAGIHPKPELVIDKFIRQLGDKRDVRGQRCVIAALGSYGPSAARAVPALIEALDDPNVNSCSAYDRSIRASAIGALRKIGKDAKAAVPRLLAIVKDTKESVDTRKYVAETLLDIDPQAGKTAEAVLRSQRVP